MRIYSILSPLFVLLSFYGGAPDSPPSSFIENCENARDDDADGLIDLNDPDCTCRLVAPQSLIPNPSFEERNCCPSSRSQLHCAKDWIQASEATTDYLHTCGWMGWPDLPPPLPIPDGEGFVGWRNGRAGGGGNPNWKEYAGACLKGPLKKGTTYRFEFWVGFTNAINSPSTNIVFYGSPRCANLPFGSGNQFFGCPLNGPGWIEMGSVPINGANEWKQYNITVTPSTDMYAMAIGPDCIEMPPVVNFYYFFDNLVLAAQSEFVYNIQLSGHPCSDLSFLHVGDIDTVSYQWYLNGIALIGQTSSKLKAPKTEGNYQVRMQTSSGCVVSMPYYLQIPTSTNTKTEYLCNGSSLRFNGYTLYQTGVYYDTLRSRNGCDSVIRLALNVLPEITDTINAFIFEGESYDVGSRRFNHPGTYKIKLNSWHGCDSLVVLFLDYFKLYFPNAFSPNGDGMNDYFTLFAPEGVAEIEQFQVFDRWGGLKYRASKLDPMDTQSGWDGTWRGKVADNGLYVYSIVLRFWNGKTKSFTGEVMLVK